MLAAILVLASGCSQRPPSPGADPVPPPIVAVSPEDARQVTVFAIKAVPGSSTIDPRLSTVRTQLRKILPDHGFELIVSLSERLNPGATLTCDLGGGRLADTTFEKDESGRVTLRCTFKDGDAPPFSTLVDAPENQLFFYERALRDGTRVLIGVGAR
ncbi:hypothetical protein [Paludisphaera mucosa]|uniref:Lipoprotein n=1 Tax=Paludisphaera mucosa TaxID=3030827 RepID=A0ABT6FIT8_9BACT|nr:hypothetical protein [Paludisphaera mucosa]MDG3007406.1 hypothetical protein [Paludisphaera mucosa]